MMNLIKTFFEMLTETTNDQLDASAESPTFNKISQFVRRNKLEIGSLVKVSETYPDGDDFMTETLQGNVLKISDKFIVVELSENSTIRLYPDMLDTLQKVG